MRNYSFHYPSPDSKYNPTSDQRLQTALAGMGERSTELHLDGDTNAVTYTFAEDAAIGVALGAATDDQVRQRMEIARDGGLAFHRWFPALLVTYQEVNDQSLGEPIVTPKQKPSSAKQKSPTSKQKPPKSKRESKPKQKSKKRKSKPKRKSSKRS